MDVHEILRRPFQVSQGMCGSQFFRTLFWKCPSLFTPSWKLEGSSFSGALTSRRIALFWGWERLGKE
ncbi:hypothetical protein RRG08_050053 [Elysia crispata]|uniref:Uncharacterized protein n=1 Tax=Elysia crispata TaxID=231223 RepID=A0AAE1BBI7_9GAST|nr:hypothetical protein RRG08_050053 [Elysia crispata]